MTTSRGVVAVVYAETASTLAHAQAALDYAARSVGSALANGPGQMHLGVCPMDGSVVNCIHQYYPTLFNFSLLGIAFAAAFLLIPKNRF